VEAAQPNLPPLSYRDFRILCLAVVFSGAGFRGLLVVLGWLLLEATDSSLIVGLGLVAMIVPNALFGILGGAIADRVDRRRLLRHMAFAMTLNMLVLGLVVMEETVVWLVLALTFVSGAIWSVLTTARQSYAYDVVGEARAIAGLSLSNLAQMAGGIFGGLGSGLIISAWGAGEAYFALAACFLAAGLTMFLARTRGQSAPVHRLSILHNLREYVSEIRSNRILAMVIALTAAVEVFGFSHLSALPVLVRDELGRGGGTLGLLGSISSAGGLVAILLLSTQGDRIRKGAVYVIVLGVFGAAIVMLGVSSTLVLALVAIAIVSGMAALSDVLSQSLVQLSVPNEMRGRAMGSWALAIGLAPFGHLQIGGLIALIGVSAALVANGAALLLLAAGAWLCIGTLRRM
jgi:MFS family permease